MIIPVIAAVFLSFTYFNAIQAPTFTGITNYIELITMDTVFMQYVLSNTLKFALIVGPVGYLLSFFTRMDTCTNSTKNIELCSLSFYTHLH